jgi:hypothetical protein
MTVTLPHASINNSFVLLPPYEGDTPLPTRPGSPVEEHPPGRIYQGPRGDTYHATSPPVATFPNSLPRGSRIHRYNQRSEEDPNRRASNWSSRSGRTDDSRRSSEGHPQGGDDGMAFVGNILQSPPAMDADLREVTRARGYRGLRGRTSSDGRTFSSRTGDGYTSQTPPTWYAHLMHDSQFPHRPTFPDSTSSSSSGGGFPTSLTRGEPRLLVSNNDHFVKLFALRPAKSASGDGSPPGEAEGKVGAKRLTNVGGVKINTAANHCKSHSRRTRHSANLSCYSLSLTRRPNDDLRRRQP